MLIACTAMAQQTEPDGPDDVHAPPPMTAPPPPPLPPQPPPLPIQQPVLPPLPPLEPFERMKPPPPPDPAEIARLEHSGHAMKAGGAVMLALGAIMEISGEVLLLHSQLTTTSKCPANGGSCTTDYHLDELIPGVIGGLAGGGLIYGGLSVLSAGSARIRRAQTLKLRIHPQFGVQQVSAQLSLIF